MSKVKKMVLSFVVALLVVQCALLIGFPVNAFAEENPPDIEAPSAPNNLASTGNTATTVDLAWEASTDNVGVTGYDVYRDDTMIDSVSGTSYAATGLNALTAYSFM